MSQLRTLTTLVCCVESEKTQNVVYRKIQKDISDRQRQFRSCFFLLIILLFYGTTKHKELKQKDFYYVRAHKT